VTKADALSAAAQGHGGSKAGAYKDVNAPARAAAPMEPRAGKRRAPLSTIRKRIAEKLVEAQRTTAYLTTFNEIDMEKISQLRFRYREEFEKDHGVKLGFMSFFVKACCLALRETPDVNAMIEGEEIVYNDSAHIGVAVSTERGLIVPVIKNADRLSLAEVEAAIADLALRARDRKILPDELSGGTFTITNGGVFGSLLSTPLPNYPQTAILGMHAIQRRPVVTGSAADEKIVIKPMMYVALTYDHRLIDGRDAVLFLRRVKELVEDPDRLLLEV
jgi:2-oxoglutarate dehydrogenase E2 component (dihydrolipoamide succinyltransferase)